MYTVHLAMYLRISISPFSSLFYVYVCIYIFSMSYILSFFSIQDLMFFLQVMYVLFYNNNSLFISCVNIYLCVCVPSDKYWTLKKFWREKANIVC